MLDTSGIYAVITKARRRLRLQAALELATRASIATSATIAVAVFLVRSQTVSSEIGWAIAGIGIACIALASLWAATRPLAVTTVATRIDRASGLSDRLASAAAFEDQLKKNDEAADPRTAELMEAAVDDAVRALPRANVSKATPFSWPTDTRAAVAFAAIATVLAGFYFPEVGLVDASTVMPKNIGKDDMKPKQAVTLDDEDLDYTEDLLDDLRQTAERTNDEHLGKFVKDVEKLIQDAKAGKLSKEQLLDKLAELENEYMKGSNQDPEQAKKDLKKTGRELQKAPETKALGKAMAKGDLDKAKQELEKLAEKLENDELSDKQKKRIAKAMKKAAEQFEKQEKQREQKQDQQIERAKKKIEKMQRRRDEQKDPEKREEMTRRIEKEKRELKKLQRRRNQRQKSEQRRALKELHRNMKKASEQMRSKNGQSQQQKKQQQKLAARSLKRAAKDTGKVDREQRKVANQKKVASQLTDLREAMRRARRKGGKGQRDMFGKNRRNKDFRRRARGKKGSKQAWKRGQGQGQGQGKGKGQGKGGQKGQGQGKGGKEYGDGHDPNIMGDPTAKQGNTEDDQLQGVQGRGESTRETILTSAQKGFSSRSYRNVYTRYKTIVEEVIRAEKVPSGYKYYVKRYFLKIKPN